MPENRFEHGRPIELYPGIRRVVAPNPGVMTGPGTNTYLLGEREVTVLDPGPPIAEHADAIIRAVEEGGGRIARIVTTHTHEDHSPATALLQERLPHRAEVIGAVIDNDGFQDRNFLPDEKPQHDRDIPVEGAALRALHTPGHVDNHFCYLHEQSGLLFTGDHIMQGSTVVIIPPAGDMKAYIESLELLLNYPLRALAPGHGEIIPEPVREVEWLIDHRLQREAKVVAACREAGEGTLDSLTPPVYDDVDPSLHPVAKFSLWAHLLKLQKEGRVDEVDGTWRFLH